MGRLSRAERWYGRLLRLYPGAYRERFEGEMRQVFRDLYREQGHPAAGFWARLTADLVVGAAAEHIAIMRSGNMKLYLSNSADQRMLYWGVGLMTPAGLFFLAAASGLLHQAQLPHLHTHFPVMPLLIAFLPMLAIVINVAALAMRAAERKVPVFSYKFAGQNFWTLALIVVALGWLALLFGHDTVGCAVQNLPHLDWAGFRHCAATH